ncbi:MAG: hypothetical protein M1820_001306 [Bogoriella megaspora]|nr:MAG: hypothetical protein M1820_001306 [Bogoriella megaspora]
MLKSTYKAQPAAPSQPELPPGWTEHKAPTGHIYYYNRETKQSTYTRPVVEVTPPAPVAPQSLEAYGAQAFPGIAEAYAAQLQNGHNEWRRNEGAFQHHGRRQPHDRPKSKEDIPGCAPWVLVKTKLGRRFVHNPETGDSFWKFPEDVMKHVVEFDRKEREKRERQERGEDNDEDEDEEAAARAELEAVAEQQQDNEQGDAVAEPNQGAEDSDEYEEIEVTDDEADEFDEGMDGRQKRQRTGKIEEDEDQPIEFNEDDIADQLAAMGEDYGLDPGEYGGGEDEAWDEGVEGLPLTEEDSIGLFKDLLDDYYISPYQTWEHTLEDGRIIDDGRYTALSNMKARRDAYNDWTRERIQQIKEQREKEEKKDPRIPYIAFLQKYASPKLYWPEFKRKYKKEPEMKNTKLSEKDKEKWYREHIQRLKLPQSTLKADLTALLKSLPLSVFNRSTSLAALPSQLLTDLRYISLAPSTRDPLIETLISTLPPAPDSDERTAEDEEATKKRREREKREAALREREQKVQEEKRKQQKELQYGKGRLQEEERELERAMKVSKEGLMGQLQMPSNQ